MYVPSLLSDESICQTFQVVNTYVKLPRDQPMCQDAQMGNLYHIVCIAILYSKSMYQTFHMTNLRVKTFHMNNL